MPHTTTIPDPPFSFLDLPREIRDRIYQYALTRDQAFLWPAPAPSFTTQPHPPSPNQLSPALLQTCHQVAHEALPLLYIQNRFSFTHPSDLNVFAHIYSPKHMRLIPRIGLHIREKDIQLWHDYFNEPLMNRSDRSIQADVPGLKYLIIFLTLNNWPNPSPPHNGHVQATLRDDPALALAVWPADRLIRRVCSMLENRVSAEVTVLASARVNEHTWGRLRRAIEAPGPRSAGPWNQSPINAARDEVAAMGPGSLRTRVAQVGNGLTGTKVMLEVFCPSLCVESDGMEM